MKRLFALNHYFIPVFFILFFFVQGYTARKLVVPHDFPNIYGALGEAEEGDTVYVVKGVYKENVALIDGVVLLGQDMHNTVIDGRRKGPCVTGADNAVVKNFTLKNGTAGVLCKNTRPVIERNLIIDNKGTGIHAIISLPDIRNNIIYRNEWTGIFLESVRGTRTSISHNVIVENGYCGIFSANKTEVLIRNNIMAGNKLYGIYVAPESKRTRIIYNNFFENRREYNSVAVINKTNMKKPPDFVSPGYPDFNYYVSAESVCKGAGEKGKDIGLITEEIINSLKYDRDGDGIPDEVDQCPDVSEDVDGFEDDDGCPDFDNDGDGIYDVDDKCPDEPEDFDGFEDDDGCPDPDNDMDGIVDEEDACPNQPETVNGYKDNDGCPDEKPEVIRETLVLEGVHFKPASAELLEESYYALEKVFNSLEAYSHVRVEIAGHTDSKGPDNYNKILSKQRAEAVKKYLELRGIDESRMKAVGYGEEQPIADNKTAEGRKKNRRVEIKPLN